MSDDPVQATCLSSLGLGVVPAGRSVRLTINLARSSGQWNSTLRSAVAPSIQVDLSALGGGETLGDSLQPVSLFAAVEAGGGTVRFAPRRSLNGWTVAQPLLLRLPPFIPQAAPGLAEIGVTVAIGDDAVDGTYRIPVVVLAESSEQAVPDPAAWIGGNRIEVVPDMPFARPQSLSLAVAVPSGTETGTIWIAAATPGIGGYPALGPADQIEGLVITAGSATATRVGGSALWSVTFGADAVQTVTDGSSACVLTLGGLPVRQQRGTGHLTVARTGIAGAADGASRMDVALESATITFGNPALKASVSSAGSITVSWNVSGANAIVVTGRNVIDPSGKLGSQTASSGCVSGLTAETAAQFSLIAYSKSFQQILSPTTSGGSILQVDCPVYPDAIQGLMQTSMVLPWIPQSSGEVTAPNGWAFCNPASSTGSVPPLNGRFLMGAGSNGAVKTKSEGQHTHTYGVDTPVTTNPAGAHQHRFPQQFTQETVVWGTRVLDLHMNYEGMMTYNSIEHDSEGYLEANTLWKSNHEHGFNVGGTAATGASTPILPAYYAVRYIIKQS